LEVVPDKEKAQQFDWVVALQFVQEASLHTNNQIFEEEDAVELNSILEPPA